jgi:hypothetical protein
VFRSSTPTLQIVVDTPEIDDASRFDRISFRGGLSDFHFINQIDSIRACVSGGRVEEERQL